MALKSPLHLFLLFASVLFLPEFMGFVGFFHFITWMYLILWYKVRGK